MTADRRMLQFRRILIMRALPPAYFLLSIVAMAALHLLVPLVRWLPVPWNVAGVLPLAAGIALAVWADGLFKRHGTAVHPYAAASDLVTEGPFKLTRNPMYLGLVLALLGIAMLLGTVTPLAVIPVFVVIISRLFIRYEEGALEQTFGAAYVDYRSKVRRWI